MVPHDRSAVLFMLLLVGCGSDPRFIFEKKPVAEVRHHGWRMDVPDERRGNAPFLRALFTREGNYLLTFGPGLSEWDPNTGELIRTLPGQLDGNDLIVADGTHHRILMRRGGVAPHLPEARGLGIWDLRDGTLIGMIPEEDRDRAIPVGFTTSGEPVVFRFGDVEVWQADGSGVRTTIMPPAGKRFCERGGTYAMNYHDQQCHALSPTGRWLAVAAWNPDERPMLLEPFLADLVEGTLVRIEVPDSVGGRGIRSFAFSSDERTLALGASGGMWIQDRSPTDRGSAARQGPFIRGEHQRNQFLSPMAFTANDTRIVALGDQLQINTYDVQTGELIGRVEPPFGDFEGTVRVSADGSRAVVYRFVADILVVIDGVTGKQRGYVCPYFCNR
ncbi:MAG: hypothetical protein OEW06_07655, partial [Gemmatimonadota bacterium]|nr:hypothetical protein [Gemmatimonadota bacterium]